MARTKSTSAAVSEGLEMAREAELAEQMDGSPVVRKKKKSFVTVKDVVKTEKGAETKIFPFVDPDTKLSRINIFDGIENADDAVTYQIPEPDVGFTLAGRGEFTEKTSAWHVSMWEPTPDQIYFTQKDGMIFAEYLTRMGIPDDRQGLYYVIAKKHYKERIPDLLQHINYFISYYDQEHEYLTALLSIKNYIDRNPNVTQKAFRQMILKRLITPTMVSKIKHMAMDLYRLNINSDADGKYRNTPKITNEHARMIVALSFCIRLILPVCIHFSNTSPTFVGKRDYIDCFDRIFMGVVDRFEKGDTEVWTAICRFVAYRVERAYTSDLIIWEKKKQLYGMTVELYVESLIHEVILVKSLHKLAFNRSIVSFFDGIISNSYMHYRYENFRFKPVEIDPDDSDSDDHVSNSEAIEMSISRVNEANQLVCETNITQVMSTIAQRFNIDISMDEFNFYFENLKFNRLSQSLLHTFFSKYFNDTNAVQLLDRADLVRLAIYLKKFMQYRGLNALAQVLTATVQGKFKDACIKNTKFMETFTTSSVYQHIIDTKFRYVRELGLKEDPIVKDLSTMINSKFIFVDMDPEINGFVCDEISKDLITSDYMTFLSIT